MGRHGYFPFDRELFNSLSINKQLLQSLAQIHLCRFVNDAKFFDQSRFIDRPDLIEQNQTLLSFETASKVLFC